MRCLLCLLFPVFVFGRCVWHPPATMFPERLVRLKTDDHYFHPRRLSAITVINGKPDGKTPVAINADHEINADRIKHSNAVMGEAHYRTREYSGGLDHSGTSEYSIVFDKSFATVGMLYDIVDVIPSAFYDHVSLSSDTPEVEVVRFTRDQLTSLAFEDRVRVGVGVRASCLPDRELGRVYYDFDVEASYDLYHSFNNTLVVDDHKDWTSQGWLSTASIMTYPPLNLSQTISIGTLVTPCRGSRLESSLDILNTSQFTYWDIDTLSYATDIKFIGHHNLSTPRCHRRAHGNVCVVLAKVRLTFGHCPKPVSFSVRQAVSHIARMSRQIYNTENKPSDFDAGRRAPVVDGLDMRYDMCESRVCQNPDHCQEYHVTNDALKSDGDIYIRQYDTRASSYLETVCTFEVVGFLDEIWSPHIYFRQWVGFNWTMVH